MSNLKILSIIPARGGSKGIPRKNIIPLQGKPLIAYTIAQSLHSQRITRTIVSTDDPEIAEISRRHGAEIPFMRPSELAQDGSPDLDVFDHALRWLQDNEGYRCDLVVHLRPTAPARQVPVIDEAVDQILKCPEATALRSIHITPWTPYKMWRMEGNYIKPLLNISGMSEPHSMGRQKLPTIYFHNAYVDIIRPQTILEQHSMCGDKVIPFLIRHEVLDIDTPDILPRVEKALVDV